jgi:putative alpha-1,2-mannosidase
MSAWYVFNALGFYPVNPASGTYMIGSPIFDKAEIKFPGNDNHMLTISAVGAKDHMYVERLKLDGIDIITPMISHEELINGEELKFTMNHQPQTWFKDQL